MKKSDMKIIAIIVTIALFVTLVTSNAVSIASVVFLSKGNEVQQGTVGGAQNNSSSENSAGDNSGAVIDNSGVDNSVVPDASNGDAASAGDNNSSSAGDSTVSANTNTNNGSSANQSSSSNGSAGNAAQSNGNGGSSSGNSNSANKPASGNNTATSNQWNKEQTFDFYKKSAHALATTGNASYDKIEYQKLDNLQVGSLGSVVQPFIDMFMTKEEDAEVQNCAKGDDSKRRFPDCTLTDMSKVVSATKKDLSNGNYEITIIMADEDTPMNEQSSFLAKVTNSVLFWEDIEKTIKEDVSIVGQINSRSVNYKGYKIVAEMTKDGKFVSLGHYATVDIAANAKITFLTLDVGATLYNNCKYSNFKY